MAPFGQELSRKRKAPVASSVVRVHRGHEHGLESDDLNEEDEDEDEEDYGLASKVSLPSKPERKYVPLWNNGKEICKIW